jgi:hypothetical protein
MYKTTSRFISTPFKRIILYSFDYTGDQSNGDILTGEVVGASVRLEYKVFQDEAGKIDKETITKGLLASGALDVDIRIIRIPRVTIRSETVLKVERLRDKVIAMNALEEGRLELPESILSKADALEDKQPDDLLEEVGGVAK